MKKVITFYSDPFGSPVWFPDKQSISYPGGRRRRSTARCWTRPPICQEAGKEIYGAPVPFKCMLLVLVLIKPNEF